MIKKQIICKKEDKLLNIISKNNISYSTANKLLRKKDIKVDNIRVSNNITVLPQQTITVYINEQEKDIKYYEKVYEDDNILIVNKFKGIEVVSAVENSLEKILNINKKIYIPINRLDRNTEGLTIFAKNKKTFNAIKSSSKNNEIKKLYLAEVIGYPNFDSKEITSYLLKDKENSHVKIFDTPKKNSTKIQTKISVVSRSSGGTSIVLVEIKNGKTHQIRAQLAHIGHPIIGDGKYGKNLENKKFKSKTQKLTAFKLVFNFNNQTLKYLNNLNFEITPSWVVL